MKTLVLIILVMLMVCVPVFASDYSGWYGWHFVGDMRFAMHAWGLASDGLDQYDHQALSPQNGWMAGSYRVNGQDEWDGPTGFYDYDDRASLQPGQSKTWMIYIWALPGYSQRDINLASGYSFASDQTDPLVAAQFECVQKPSGVIGGPALGTVWAEPDFSLELPYYGTNNGLTGYCFKFTLTMIPEPSSLLALLGGVVGLGGIAWRRRR